jgi:hypothetical protein
VGQLSLQGCNLPRIDDRAAIHAGSIARDLPLHVLQVGLQRTLVSRGLSFVFAECVEAFFGSLPLGVTTLPAAYRGKFRLETLDLGVDLLEAK